MNQKCGCKTRYSDCQRLDITCDTGAEVNLIRADQVEKLGITMRPSKHRATQADGKSSLKILGECNLSLNRGDITFFMDAHFYLAIKSLSTYSIERCLANLVQLRKC